MKEKDIHAPHVSAGTQRGQAIVLIAMGFVMLLAFTGLVVDVARVFVMRGELRRAVDAAGLAATAQFRQGATGQKIVSAAYDLVATHGVFSPTVTVQTCNLAGTAIDTSLCTNPMRKLVRVSASAEVPMLFLQLVGINNVQVEGTNTSEAASVEAVLVLDNSESQSYDFSSLPSQYASCNQSNINDIYYCLNGGTLSNGVTVNGCNNEPITDATVLANYPGLNRGICQPFLKTKEAAYAFIRRLYEGYDRVAIVNFNELAYSLLPLTFNLTGGAGSAIDSLNNMDVYVNTPYVNPVTGHVACNSATPPVDFWKCGSSNIADGLRLANNEFGRLNPVTGLPIIRQDALWVTLLLVDGAANRAPINSGLAWSDPTYGVCPLSERSTALRCRDADVNTRHKANDIGAGFGLYDADDYARDMGDQLGLDPNKYATTPLGGKPDGVLIYTIALGKDSVCSNGAYTPPSGTAPATCTNYNTVYGDPDAAEQLLRYIADIGDDGDMTTGPCIGPKSTATGTWGIPTSPLSFAGRSNQLGLQCGNYYFAPSPSDLERVFLEIAGRIFTRISG
jgi:hypothetical protein